MKYAIYAGTSWVCDEIAESEEEALKKGQDTDPMCDHVQIISEIEVPERGRV